MILEENLFRVSLVRRGVEEKRRLLDTIIYEHAGYSVTVKII